MAAPPPKDDGILLPILYALLGGVGLSTLILIGGITVTYLRGPSQAVNLGTAPAVQTQANAGAQSVRAPSTSGGGSASTPAAVPEPQPEPEEDLPEEPPQETQTPAAMPEVTPNPEPEPEPPTSPTAPASTGSAAPNAEPVVTPPPAPSAPSPSGNASSNAVNTPPASGEREWKGTFLGSAKSDKYHDGWCQAAKKILVENEVWFGSETEAQAAHYTRCGICW